MRKVNQAGKKKWFNAILAIAAATVVFAGVMITASVQGWFDAGQVQLTAGIARQETVENVRVSGKTGGANIERSGIAYAMKEGMLLKDGDIIETLSGSEVEITVGSNRIVMNQNSEAAVRLEEAEATVALVRGEAFFETAEPLSLEVAAEKVTTEGAVFSVSAPVGSAGIFVYGGTVRVGTETVNAGKLASVLPNEIITESVAIQSLNDFAIKYIRRANESTALCFTNAQLDAVTAEREAEIRAAFEEKQQAAQKEQEIEERRKQNEEKLDAQQSGGTGASTSAGSTTGGTGKGGATGDGEVAHPSCTIEIRCDTVLNNMGDLTTGKNAYVPSNGVILATSSLQFTEGETVFDVLKRACALAEIQLEYSFTPAYNSYYIEGINNLYEFDCGNESGWMYKVNGWFPNYGCSAYPVKNGDVIVWCYTCKGLGADVGGSVY